MYTDKIALLLSSSYSTFSLILVLLWLGVFLDGCGYDVANDSKDFFLARNNFLSLLHWILRFFFFFFFLDGQEIGNKPLTLTRF